MIAVAFLPLIFFLSPQSMKAGLDKYTFLDKIGDWTVERKYDSEDNDILCRASILKYGSWFGARIRLNQDDLLVIPKSLKSKNKISKLDLEKVKKTLEICRSGLFYLPD